ncbi:DUF2238 domain-containing protein [Methylococcus sp. EFPC2]|uniref:DUF2238 domain-containing protein n=1 Tax=Methylococcus sp. EFPC2 TaxID=2812648 RepID=UPI00196890C6|nr:DUF2238 domain-containing protein [Methylococcus sp. EFPC2]QSA95854.1 DUF2238 domain-containing protein [Methylococcus sp. EFPC2]
MNRTWVALFFGVLLWSGLSPHDYLTWFLEVLPALIGFVLLAATRRSFPLTPLAYWLILFECLVLMVGGHYTYAHVPVFEWINGYFDHGRNNFDKFAHFFQGFVPAIAVREVLLRFSAVNGRGWLFFLVSCVCLAVSAFYEMIEWWVAVVAGGSSEAFLGTQGYAWDTQSDMALALLGSMLAQLGLRRLHDAQLARL